MSNIRKMSLFFKFFFFVFCFFYALLSRIEETIFFCFKYVSFLLFSCNLRVLSLDFKTKWHFFEENYDICVLKFYLVQFFMDINFQIYFCYLFTSIVVFWLDIWRKPLENRYIFPFFATFDPFLFYFRRKHSIFICFTCFFCFIKRFFRLYFKEIHSLWSSSCVFDVFLFDLWDFREQLT